MKKGFLAFHQGWTDIINCLPLIDYYLEYYDELKVFAKAEARELFLYYIRNKPPVSLIHHENEKDDLIKNPEYKRLFHGFFDGGRDDSFVGAFHKSNEHFVKRFYTSYNIDYETRVKYFCLDRDVELEEKMFQDFTSKYGKDYILVHDTAHERPINICKTNKHINIGSTTSNFFSMIKVLENAKEIHVIDSVWGSLCYLLDCKYGLFKHIPVKIYPFLAEGTERSGGCLKTKYEKVLEPFHPANWEIVI